MEKINIHLLVSPTCELSELKNANKLKFLLKLIQTRAYRAVNNSYEQYDYANSYIVAMLIESS